MANNNFTKWHISGLHAVRSASEQGATMGKELAGKVSDPKLKALLTEFGETAATHQENYVGFLKEFEAAPNDFKDRIMEGVTNGTSEMVKAAPDQDLIDMSAINGSQAGIYYFIGAFKGQSALAQQLGRTEQSETLAAMAEDYEELNARFVKAGDMLRAKAAEEVRHAA